MIKWIDAKLWIGKERESSEKEIRLYIDNASIEEIKQALETHPEISSLYFGHEFDDNVLNYFFNKIRILVEVDKIINVPEKFVGKIDVILRVPSCVTGIKFIRGNRISILMYDDKKAVTWTGRKTYETDRILL